MQICRNRGLFLLMCTGPYRFLLIQLIVSANCGAQSSENCTYVESQGSEIGDCTVKVCQINSNICQLRLDFNTFVINGPSSATVSVGIINTANPYSLRSNCLTDKFSVTSPGNPTPPIICGMNSGEHSKASFL